MPCNKSVLGLDLWHEHLFATAGSFGRAILCQQRLHMPVFDVKSGSEPLARFNDDYSHVYPEYQVLEDNLDRPDPSILHEDHYLYPVLTRNEYLRLTMLWYYTRDLAEDKDLLSRLHIKVELLKEFVGWDFAILGLLENHAYRRVVTSGIGLARLPRRESTCSHIVHGTTPGDVFVVSDMQQDWRFKGSPHVCYGGIRSYAGTILRCQVADGDAVALGSLCLASEKPNLSFTKSQHDALVRFSDMKVQQRMSERIARATASTDINLVEKSIMAVLDETYTGAQIKVCKVQAQSIPIDHGRRISLSSLQHGLWEDSVFIDNLIATKNHEEIKTDHTIRAVVGRFWSQPVLRVLVVSTNEVTQVFDDIDAWFVDRCSAVLSNIVQEKSLKEARQAKEQFLRGITHQLRTPIHGVLGSVDILAEELAARDLLKAKTSADTAAIAEDLVQNIAERASEQHRTINTTDVLRTIQNSGRELMSTVNNMIKLNRWAEVADAKYIPTLNDLSKLEDMLLEETTRMLPDNEVERLCYTSMGCIIVSASLSDDCSDLIFEVKDTGRGIRPENKAKIFEAYEKEDAHGRGAGLGLTLAAKMASAMHGSVELVNSEPDAGSTFRVTFRDSGVACRTGTVPHKPSTARVKITAFSTVPVKPITYTVQHFTFNEYLTTASNFTGTAVCLIPTSEDITRLQQHHPHVSFLTSPFTTKRLDDIMDYLESLYARRRSLKTSTPALTPDREHVSRSLSVAAISIQELRLDPPTSPFRRTRSKVVPHVLLVDDNLINLRIVRMYCDRRYLPYDTAMDGFQAIDAYKKALDTSRPYGLILLDLQMPNCDGIEACEEIRRMEEERGLPRSVIFIITGQDSPRDRERAGGAGADEFYVKPMSLKALDKAIGGYFESPA
ncbi:hypothetical protein KVT40_001980 [Elsinoe batatas]|uniref:histidine kinase n=1 Tax=Elsinoe batatas TaxID=2601811 RepID=A0A8K0PHS4_9PEZI|nr:hypothetical protein KVT40_001980 [Elsinoe batatas]